MKEQDDRLPLMEAFFDVLRAWPSIIVFASEIQRRVSRTARPIEVLARRPVAAAMRPHAIFRVLMLFWSFVRQAEASVLRQ